MRIETNGTGVKKARDTYEKLYAILTRESSARWDFTTLNQTQPVNSTLGKAMGYLLVQLKYLDRVEDRFKHWVPTPQELERMVRDA